MCGAYPQPQVPGQRPPAWLRGIDNEIPRFTTQVRQNARASYRDERGFEHSAYVVLDPTTNEIIGGLPKGVQADQAYGIEPVGQRTTQRIVNPAYVAEAESRVKEHNQQTRRQARRAERQAIPPPPPPPVTPPPPQLQTPVISPGPQQQNLPGTGGGRGSGSGGPTGRGALVIPIDLGGSGGGHSLAIPT